MFEISAITANTNIHTAKLYYNYMCFILLIATTTWILGGLVGVTTEFFGISSSVGIPGPRLTISNL